MNCSKCQGLLVTEQVPAETIVLTVDKCLNCGMRKEHDHVPVPHETTSYRRRVNKCLNCNKPPTPGYAQCAHCREYQAQYRKENPRSYKGTSKGTTSRRAVGPVWI